MSNDTPRGGVGRDDVFQAADQLDADGRKPTLEAVRAVIGRGSYATITQYLREWKKLKEHQQEPEAVHEEAVPERIERLMQGVARQIWAEARNTAELRLSTEREEMEKVNAQLGQQHQEALDLADTLEMQKDKLADQVAHLLPHIETLESKVQTAEAKATQVQAVLEEARTHHKEQQARTEAEIRELRDDLAAAIKREAETHGRLQAIQEKDDDEKTASDKG